MKMKKKTSILSVIMAMVLVISSSIFNIVEAATGQDVVNYAKKFIGTPYVWGGTTPNGFDCSGFVQYVYKNAAGINLPRTTYDQINVGTAVSQNNLQPGDLVFPSTEHVGIYVGNGQMIHAPHKGDAVKISSVYKFYAGRRISGITQCPYVSPADANAKPIKKLYMVIETSAVVRSAPCDSATVVRTLNHGEVIDIYAEYGEWSLVARGKRQQWVKTKYLAPRVPVVDDGNAEPIKRRYMVIETSAVVRNYPSDSATVVRTLNHGEVIDIYAEHGEWSLVARGKRQQWVKTKYLAPRVPVVDDANAEPIKRRYMVIETSAVVRNYPSDSATVVRTLNHGEVIDIYAEHGEWSLVARGKKQQWVKTKYLAPTK